MKIVVLGATGGTGQEIVRQAVDRGHCVTAFVRSATRLKPLVGRIRIVEGDLLNCEEMEGALRGHDAVLSAFGPRLPIAPSDEDLLERFAGSLTCAMRNAGVRRVVVESTAFLFRDSLLPPAYLFGRLFFPRVVADASAMERIFAASGLDWTMVRPPRLSDGSHRGNYRMLVGKLPMFGFSISRADVADCLLRASEDRGTIGKVLGASY